MIPADRGETFGFRFYALREAHTLVPDRGKLVERKTRRARRPYSWRSVLKRVVLANYAIFSDFACGRFTLGQRTFDRASGVIDLSYSGGYLVALHPRIDAASAAIVGGDVLVPPVPPEREARATKSGCVSTEASCER
jgi:hypothetical protein